MRTLACTEQGSGMNVRIPNSENPHRRSAHVWFHARGDDHETTRTRPSSSSADRTAFVSADPTAEADRGSQFEIEFLDDGVETYVSMFG
jgi:hypothetical protein